MTDDELAAILVETAALGRDTNAGVTAMFAIAGRLQHERPEFAGGPRMVRGGHTFSGEFAAQKMLYIVRSGRPANEAVAWLRKVSDATCGVGGAVKALYGVTCSERIALSGDVVLLPYLELPQSETRDYVLAEHDRANDARLLLGFVMPPHAALYRGGTLEPIFSPHTPDYHKLAPTSWFADLDIAELLLALTPSAIPSEVVHWFHYDDADIALLGQRGLTSRYNEVRSPFRMAAGPTLITPESAAGLLTAYGRLGAKDQGRIALALQRLIRSRVQNNAGNGAIDLAIALEVLFMNQDQGEHSYKISIRLAKLLGGTLAAQRTAVIETRRLYDLRSSMVHTGTADNDWPVDGTRRSAGEILSAGDLRCTQAIRKFLELGRIPADWRDIELAGDATRET